MEISYLYKVSRISREVITTIALSHFKLNGIRFDALQSSHIVLPSQTKTTVES